MNKVKKQLVESRKFAILNLGIMYFIIIIFRKFLIAKWLRLSSLSKWRILKLVVPSKL